MIDGFISLGTSGNITGQIVWSSQSNGIEKNTSTVTATIQVKRTNSYTTYGTWTGSLNVGGITETFSKYAHVTNTWVTLHTIETTVAHAADGVGSCYMYGQIKGPSETSQANSIVKASSTVTLETIPRYASLTSAPNFNDEENPTIYYTNPAGDSVVVLQACISLDGKNDDISYRDIPKTGTSYTFELTEEERNVLRYATLNGSTTRTVRFYIRTGIGDTIDGSYLTRNFTVINCAPTLDPIVGDSNNDVIEVTGDMYTIVRYMSEPSYAFRADGVKGADLKTCTVSNGSIVHTYDEPIIGTFTNISEPRFTFTVLDERGQKSTAVIDKERDGRWVPYVKPTCNLGNNQPNAEGVLNIDVDGMCYNGYFDKQNSTPSVSNTIAIYYRYKPTNGDYERDWTRFDGRVEFSNVYTNRYAATLSLSLQYQTAYVIEVYAEDLLSRTDVASKTVKASPVFDWSDEDFNLNVKLNMAGSTVLMREAGYGYAGDVILSATGDENCVVIRPSGGDDASGVFFHPEGDMSVDRDVYVGNDLYVVGALALDNETVLRRNPSDGSAGAGNVVLSSPGAKKGIFIRPQGTDVGTAQTVFRADGVVEFSNNITVDGGISYSGAAYPIGAQSVLWDEGGFWMMDTQTITLSSPISSTVNGIVLVFAPYSNNAAGTTNYNSFFVPKCVIGMFGTTTHNFNMAVSGFGAACMKVLRISDTHIQGVSANSAYGTGSSGITYDNRTYVLRYVIGV